MRQCAEEYQLYQQNYPDAFITKNSQVGAHLPDDNYSLSIYPKMTTSICLGISLCTVTVMETASSGKHSCIVTMMLLQIHIK